HKGTEHLQADIRSRIKGLSEEIEGPKRGGNRAGPLYAIRPDTLGARVIAACATAQQSVGLNKSIPTLHGRVSFEYRVVSTAEIGDHIYFAMIPIQETGYHRSGVIEVGTDRRADPRNPKSPYRIRYMVPRGYQEDADWHSGILDFDFREIPTAFYSIFAFRINEGIGSEKGSMHGTRTRAGVQLVIGCCPTLRCTGSPPGCGSD
ncbi:MAG: hypothetical protein ACREYC_26935, partial [Gammaproteobacteria bacterium]